jgi:DNA-binding SARP family transcriptional activator/Tfp pilus assembly protein PilF
MIQLELFGSPSIRRADGVPLGSRAVQRHRLALLALLALHPGRRLRRDRLIALLWPESGQGQGRNLLKVSVYVLRQALGEDSVLTKADEVCLNPERVEADVIAFEAALSEGDPGRAVALYRGPFLDGFHLPTAADFERWVDAERALLAGSYCKALETLAEAAQGRGDPSGSAAWWKTRAAQDPYDSRVALRLMHALDAAGNRAGALQHAHVHQQLLRAELDIAVSREVAALAADLRTQTPASADGAEINRQTGLESEAAHNVELARLLATRFRLETLGGLALRGRLGPHPDTAANCNGLALALLAVLAPPGEAGVARDQLLLLFWPDGPPSAARESLDQLLAGLRTSIDEAVVIGDDPLRLNPAVVTCDVSDFERALAHGAFAEAVEHFRGEFLDGFDADGLPELKQWLTAQRERLAKQRDFALAQLARTPEHGGNDPAAGPAHRRDAPRRPWPRFALAWGVAALLLGALVAFATRQAWPPLAEDIAEAVAREVGERLDAARASGPRRPLTQNAAALELYDRCSDWMVFRSDSMARAAFECLRRATDLDPTFAAPYAIMAILQVRIGFANDPSMSGIERMALAERYATKAVQLDDSLAQAHVSMGYIRLIQLRFAEAEAELAYASELDPDHAPTYRVLSSLYLWLGQFEKALEQALRAQKIEPLAPKTIAELAHSYYVNGQCDKSFEWLARIADVDPPLLLAGMTAALCHVQEGMWAEAAQLVLPPSADAALRTQGNRGYVLARIGHRDLAEAILEQQIDAWEQTRSGAFWIGQLHMGLRNYDSAFVWLDRSIDDGSFDASIREPHFDELRADPRYEKLLRRVGLQKR